MKSLFGLDLFNFKKDKKPKVTHFYDFAQHGIVGNSERDVPMMYVLSPEDYEKLKNQPRKKPSKKTKKLKKSEMPLDVHFTPKGIFQMKALNAHDFYIKTDPKYIDEQVKNLEAKLKFIGDNDKTEKLRHYDFGGVKFAGLEVESVIERLKLRSKLPEVEDIVNKYPHTTTQLIEEVLNLDKGLACKKADEFVPDFPNEAIKAMDEYNEMCMKLANKKTYFYVIADKKDFEVKNKRRDPILLAQSPFGHFWQILGAWDKEMIYLGDL